MRAYYDVVTYTGITIRTFVSKADAREFSRYSKVTLGERTFVRTVRS